MRKILILTLVMLLSTFTAARDYSIQNVDQTIIVQKDGTVHVKESITYHFSGIYYEVFRTLDVPSDAQVINRIGGCDNDYCTFEDRAYELTGVLKQPTPETVRFNIEYDYVNVLKVYNDVSELHMKLWGDEWDKPVELRTNIQFPAEIQEYWMNPEQFIKENTLQASGNSLDVQSSIPPNSWFETRVAFARLADAQNAIYYDYDGLDKIRDVEGSQDRKERIFKIVFALTMILYIFWFSIPYLIYRRFGREPDVDYNALYERELPTNHKPAIVNAFMKGRIGTPTIEGFTATIMDLINKKLLDISGSYDNPTITVKTRTVNLERYEKDILNLIKKHSTNNKIIWKEFKKKLSKGTDFYNFISSWNKSVRSQTNAKSMFEQKGNHFLIAYGFLTFFLSFVFPAGLVSIFEPNLFPLVMLPAMLTGLLFFYAVIIIIVSVVNQKIFGKFTPEGRIFYLRWSNFKKYLTDFSALKDHPPQSVILWDHYMVYAVALGVAEEALKNMKLVVPAAINKSAAVYAPLMSTGFRSSYSASMPSSSGSGGGFSGGVGGVGGGFGGGGGGAR